MNSLRGMLQLGGGACLRAKSSSAFAVLFGKDFDPSARRLSTLCLEVWSRSGLKTSQRLKKAKKIKLFGTSSL